MEQLAMMVLQTMQIYATRLERGPALMEYEVLCYEKLCDFSRIYAIAQAHNVEVSCMLFEQQKINAAKVHQDFLEKRLGD